MNISINTFYRETHAGAVMQAYALSRILKDLGYEPEMLAYDRPARGGGRKTVKQRLIRLVTREAETIREYAVFRATYLRESRTVYHGPEEIAANPPHADAYICGSDQIWNPGLLFNNQFDPAYFLKFGLPATLRISYAASFGGYQPGAEQEQLLRTYLSRFSAISVREPNAQAMLSKILGREVALTLDPTLLVNDYSELLNPSADAGRYILLYSLQNSAEIRRAARELSTHYGLPIWSIDGPLLPWKVLGRRIESRGPLQWINLINGAAAVVTNSLHGLIFSLMLKKRVIVSPQTGPFLSKNERMMHLCNALGVTREVIPTDVSDAIRREINWDLLDQNLTEYRQSSLYFLRNALASREA